MNHINICTVTIIILVILHPDYTLYLYSGITHGHTCFRQIESVNPVLFHKYNDQRRYNWLEEG